jgi:hypothetical protein
MGTSPGQQELRGWDLEPTTYGLTVRNGNFRPVPTGAIRCGFVPARRVQSAYLRV